MNIQPEFNTGIKIATIDDVNLYIPDYKDTLSSVAISGQYKDLEGKPYLASIALTGKYDDLENVPTTNNIIRLNDYKNDLISEISAANFVSLGILTDLVIDQYHNFYNEITETFLSDDIDLAITEFFEEGKLLIIQSLYGTYIVNNIIVDQQDTYIELTLNQIQTTNYNLIRSKLKNDINLIRSELKIDEIRSCLLIIDKELDFIYFK